MQEVLTISKRIISIAGLGFYSIRRLIRIRFRVVGGELDFDKETQQGMIALDTML